MELNLFLEEATKVFDDQKKEKSKDSEFNIFTILDKETDEESTHCRFIYELLSPNGTHNQGDKFLKLFFNTVLGIKEKEYPVGYVVVRREVCLTDESRLDLMIDTDDCCYLIEAKINAGEQYRQIERYCDWAKERGKSYEMYFLTLNGRESKTANEHSYKQISFKTEIINWLEECEKATNICSLKGAIIQYEQLLYKLTSEGKQNMNELDKLIKDNIITAQKISEQLPKIKAEMVGKVLNDIENHISDKYNFSKIVNVLDYYAEDNKYQKYYSKGGKNPRISFELFSEESTGHKYCLSVVIEYSLFIGCDILREVNGKYVPIEITEDRNDEKIYNTNYLINKFHTSSSLWYWWEYLQYDGDNINFYETNDNFYDLFNNTKYEDILTDIKNKIDTIIKDLNI